MMISSHSGDRQRTPLNDSHSPPQTRARSRCLLGPSTLEKEPLVLFDEFILGFQYRCPEDPGAGRRPGDPQNQHAALQPRYRLRLYLERQLVELLVLWQNKQDLSFRVASMFFPHFVVNSSETVSSSSIWWCEELKRKSNHSCDHKPNNGRKILPKIKRRLLRS